MKIVAQNQNLGDSIIDWANNSVPKVISDAGTYFNSALWLLVLIILALWAYCGVIILRDSLKRFHFEQKWIYIIILILGILSGPIGLIIYKMFKPKNTADELEFIKVEHKFYYHQASKVVDCLNCGAYVLENHMYCTNCGTQNRYKCSKCGTLTDYDDLYCYSCGLDFGKRSDEILKKIQSKKEKKTPTQNPTNTQQVKTSTTKPNLNLSWARIKQGVSKVASKSKEVAKNTYSIASEQIKKTSSSLRGGKKSK